MPFTLPTRAAPGRVVGSMAAAAIAVALLLGGCTGMPGPSPIPTPTTDASEPIFTSDDEALAAAIEAYEGYRAVSATIAADGGDRADRINATVTPEYAETLLNEFAALSESGAHFVGSSSFDTTSLAEWSFDGRTAAVSIYLCRDVSDVRVIGPDSKDITPTDREDRVASQALLVSSNADPHKLVVDGVEKWPGDDFC
jgi:hypothetical protein